MRKAVCILLALVAPVFLVAAAVSQYGSLDALPVGIFVLMLYFLHPFLFSFVLSLLTNLKDSLTLSFITLFRDIFFSSIANVGIALSLLIEDRVLRVLAVEVCVTLSTIHSIFFYENLIAYRMYAFTKFIFSVLFILYAPRMMFLGSLQST